MIVVAYVLESNTCLIDRQRFVLDFSTRKRESTYSWRVSFP